MTTAHPKALLSRPCSKSPWPGSSARSLLPASQFIANPLRDEDFARLHAAASARAARLVVVTLAPPLNSVVLDRGARQLTPDERARVAEMYREGYHQRAFTDLLITDAPSPAAAARDIVMRLSQMSVTPLFP